MPLAVSGMKFRAISATLRPGAGSGKQHFMRIEGKHSPALALIKTAMIEKKITQAELADAADIHEKTIQNLLSGRSVRDQTLFDVCMVLGLDFAKVKAAWVRAGHETRDAPEPNGAEGRAAPVYMGAYTRAGVDHYIGSYLTVRPSFSMADGIMAYRTDIAWDDEWPSLLFQERDRPDKPYLHRGRLYIPASSMYVHLVSLTKGAMRMVMVSQLGPDGQMRGLITTLSKQRAQLVPVSRAHRLHQARRLRRRGAGRDRRRRCGPSRVPAAPRRDGGAGLRPAHRALTRRALAFWRAGVRPEESFLFRTKSTSSAMSWAARRMILCCRRAERRPSTRSAGMVRYCRLMASPSRAAQLFQRCRKAESCSRLGTGHAERIYCSS